MVLFEACAYSKEASDGLLVIGYSDFGDNEL